MALAAVEGHFREQLSNVRLTVHLFEWTPTYMNVVVNISLFICRKHLSTYSKSVTNGTKMI